MMLRSARETLSHRNGVYARGIRCGRVPHVRPYTALGVAPSAELFWTSGRKRTRGAFSHSARTAPVITVFTPVTALKTCHL